MAAAIEILQRDRRIVLDPVAMRSLAAVVAEGEGRDLRVSVCVVDDAEIRRINREFLGHDYATDVVTFDLRDDIEPELDGEIVVSAEFAEASARDLGHDPLAELSFYVCHGMLHLCGHDDASHDERTRMLDLQRRYLAKVGIHGVL